MNCEHKALICEITHNQMRDANVRVLELSARCEACGRSFMFLGAPIGTSLRRPTISADALTVSFPIVAENESPDTQTEAVLSAVRPIGLVQ